MFEENTILEIVTGIISVELTRCRRTDSKMMPAIYLARCSNPRYARKTGAECDFVPSETLTDFMTTLTLQSQFTGTSSREEYFISNRLFQSQ